MTNCLCPDCSPEPAPTYLESWRHQCEARYVARMPDQIARTAYLEGVAQHRGAQSSAELRAAARAVFDAMAKRKVR